MLREVSKVKIRLDIIKSNILYEIRNKKKRKSGRRAGVGAPF